MTVYSSKMPDMSRNIALAGKTVSSHGMNVTYDENGYAVRATHYGNKQFAETVQSVRAQSIDAALGGERPAAVGSTYDREHFSDKELAEAEEKSRQVAEGTLSVQEFNEHMENVRALYGYSGGASGNEFIALSYPKQPGEVLAEERAAAQPALVQSGTATAESLQSAPEDSDTEQLHETYQAQLVQQQQQQTIKSELLELQNDVLLKTYGEKKKSELMDLLFEDDPDQ